MKGNSESEGGLYEELRGVLIEPGQELKAIEALLISKTALYGELKNSFI